MPYPSIKHKTMKNKAKLVQLVRMKEGEFKSFDGTRIHYRTSGQGSPLVLCNGFGVASFYWKYLEKFFRNHHQVIVWDYRGHGHSGSPKKLENATVDALVEDCCLLLDHLHIKKATLFGFSLGTQIVLDFYKKYPEKIQALILCLGTYGKPMDTFYNSPLSRYIYEIITFIGTVFPQQGNWLSRVILKNPFWFQIGGFLKMIDTGMASKQDAEDYVDHILKIDPEFFATLFKSVQEHSTEENLKNIKVPTLIIGAENDYFTPAWISKKMNRTIPKSELFILKKATHSALLEQPELINLRIDKFMKERVPTPSSPMATSPKAVVRKKAKTHQKR